MWFLSRCISVDSLNSCFQQQKNKTSYDFDLCKDDTEISARRNDDDDCEPLSKKPSYNHHYRHHYQHNRRRIPKRYSDIISPSSTRMFLSRKDSINREKYNHYHRSSTNIHRRHSLKPLNETIYYFNSSKNKFRESKDHHYKHNDHLAHRMQAAMSSELRHSLDRNFILNERRQLLNHLFVTRSHSFNISTSWNKKFEQNSSHHFIPRAKINLKKNHSLIKKSRSNYNDIIIRTIQNKQNDIYEEPIADYDEPKSLMQCEIDEKSNTHSDLGVSSSFILPQISINNNEEQIFTPPVPPPLPNLNNEGKKIAFRCRTIADKLSSDHKLILKDENEEKPINPSEPSKPHYIHVSKELTLRKISQTLSRSSSLSNSLFHLNNHHQTELPTLSTKPLISNEQIQDCLSSSSPTPSIIIDNEDEHRSSSTKIYNDYKKRTSLTTKPSNTMIRNHSMIIHPMHTQIGLRSSTSSSTTNEKLIDMTLSSKQMNVCVINQLNEHLSTRFRNQQQETTSNNNQSYEPPPESMTNNNHHQANVYDEPDDIPIPNPINSSSIPPPPPPLPAGGFRPIIPSIIRSSNSQRTSIMTLSREANNSDLPACSTGTSTISSNLSDTRILRELRENPLFTRAKEHLQIEPGLNGRRLISSTRNLTNINDTNNETVSYLRLENCSKTNLKKSPEEPIPKQLETIIMLPNELNAIIGKRTKSINDINQVKSRSSIKSSIQTQYRQSELELIFQKRAQRSEQNLS